MGRKDVKKEDKKEEVKDEIFDDNYSTFVTNPRAQINRFIFLRSNSKIEDNCYLISMIWWNRFKAYFEYDETKNTFRMTSNFGKDSFKPGPINNFELINDKIDISDKFLIKPNDPKHIFNIHIYPTLKPDIDYKVISSREGEFLHKIYNGNPIGRFILPTNNQIEKMLKKFKILILPSLDEIRKSNITDNLVVNSFYFSLCLSVFQLKMHLISLINPSLSQKNLRLWQTEENILNEFLFFKIKNINPSFYKKKEKDDLFECNCNIDFPGICLEEYLFSKLVFIDLKPILVLEESSEAGEFIFSYSKQPTKGKCKSCKKFTILKVSCSCKVAFYCSEQCRESHKLKHRNKCLEGPTSNIVINASQNSKKGIVGLTNLGNTCYMNSCLQALSNIPELKKYYGFNEYLKDINKDNLESSKGQISKVFGKLVNVLWNGSYSNYKPSQFKDVFSFRRQMFQNFEQHDSNEFLTQLIDELNEDTKNPENKMNFIEKVLYGNHIISLSCNKCNKVIQKKEKFNSIVLPIPSKIKISFLYYKISTEFNHYIKQINMELFNSDNFENAYWNLIELKELKELTTQNLPLFTCIKNNQVEFISLGEPIKKYLKSFIIIFSISKAFIAETDQKIFTEKYLNNLTYNQVINKLFFNYEIILLIFSNSELKADSSFNGIFFSHLFSIKLTKTDFLQNLGKLINHFVPSIEIKCSKDEEFFEKEIKLNYFPYECLNNEAKPKIPLNGIKQEFLFEYEKFILPFFPQNSHETPILMYSKIIYIHFSQFFLNNYKIEKLEFLKGDSLYFKISQNLSLTNCINNYELEEELDENNKWKCDNCLQHVNAIRSIVIEILPPILIISFQRFRMTNVFISKKDDFIQYPIKLSKLAFKNLDATYSLISVIRHKGTMNFGHYTCTCLNEDTQSWFLYDDEKVRKINNEEVLSKDAYILFYKKQ